MAPRANRKGYLLCRPEVKMVKTGRDLQRLVRAIEGARSAGQPIQIESPKRIRDRVTGKLREHDVVLTITHEHHTVVIALECRDRSRPVGVDAVEAFHNKCKDTGIHSGVMVSSKGFARTALTKAKAYNIRCMSLDEVPNFDWRPPATMELTRRMITSAQLNFDFQVEKLPKLNNPVLQDEHGGAMFFDQSRVLEMAHAALKASDHPSIPGEYNVNFREESPSIFLVDGERRVQAASRTLSVSFRVTVEQAPVSLRRYSEAGNNAIITEAAVATFASGNGTHADLAITKQADGTLVLRYVPNSTKPE